ncbi:hypothetical protein [Bacillus horti]|uniref:Uncharacterized protein n=1 Tax=Caldalkalibacillus horti TaxID=77523 RepID=A0ABT9VWA1_9BACI|nr:hypothetical protein [Bacillus horti]MDQ0165268.1 hypothetical protein [Bacillus horti]
MGNFLENAGYVLTAIILGIISFFTQEIVTYFMLGMILIALINILNVLKVISKKLNY